MEPNRPFEEASAPSVSSAFPEVGRHQAPAADSDQRAHGLKRGYEQPSRARIIGPMIAPAARMMLPYPAAIQKNMFLMTVDKTPLAEWRWLACAKQRLKR